MKPRVHVADTSGSLENAVTETFSFLEDTGGPVLKASKRVYIKINGIDFKKHCFTSPVVLEAVISFLKDRGASVHVMENSTQSNMTRIVFAVAGFKEACKRAGARIHYLDEEQTKPFKFSDETQGEDGYELEEYELPATVIDVIKHRDEITYINLPKLKMHSMTAVTLGMKNQWGLLRHDSRGRDHNYLLHAKIADVYARVKPDITIIDGTEATVHGHYPPTAFEDRLVVPFNVLISGRDTVAVDAVGARIFGLKMEDVPHLRIAHERGLGIADVNKIDVSGTDLNTYATRYDWDLLQEFPPDVKVVRGNEMNCLEGCRNNPLALLQVLAYDHPHKFKGGWFIVMGKGFSDDLPEELREEGFTKGLVAGKCAVDEVGERLRAAFGKKNVHFSGECNDLASTASGMFKLSGVSTLDMVPLPAIKAFSLLLSAKLHGSTARIPPIF